MLLFLDGVYVIGEEGLVFRRVGPPTRTRSRTQARITRDRLHALSHSVKRFRVQQR